MNRLTQTAFLIASLLFIFGCGDDVMGPDSPNRPIQPTNVVAMKTDEGVELSWQDNSSNESGFIVWRGHPMSKTGWRQIFAVRFNETEMLDYIPLTTYPEVADNKVGYVIEAVTAKNLITTLTVMHPPGSPQSNFVPISP